MAKYDPNDDFYVKLLGIKCKLFNPNPRQRYNSKVDRNDCFIRSLCAITGKKWVEIAQELFTISCESGLPMDSANFIRHYLIMNDWVEAEELDVYESLGEFVYNEVNKTGKYLCFASEGHHIVAYIDGELWDNVPCMKLLRHGLVQSLEGIWMSKEAYNKRFNKEEK